MQSFVAIVPVSKTKPSISRNCVSRAGESEGAGGLHTLKPQVEKLAQVEPIFPGGRLTVQVVLGSGFGSIVICMCLSIRVLRIQFRGFC